MTEYIHVIKSKSKKKYAFVLLSANRPKIRGYRGSVSLFQCDRDNLLIDLQIKAIKESYPYADIFLVTGYDANSVISYVSSKFSFVKILENLEYADTSSIHSFRMAVNVIGEDTNVFAIHGDRLFNKKAISVDAKNASKVYSHKQEKISEKIGICYQSSVLKNMSYGLPSIWSEIVYFAQPDYKKLKSLVNRLKSLSIYSMCDLINYSINANLVSYNVDSASSVQIQEIGD